MNLLDDAELIITTDGGKVKSAGFTIFNRFLSNKVQPMHTLNVNGTGINLDDQKKVSSRFKGFVVPIGLQDPSSYDMSSKEEEQEGEGEGEKDLYESLLDLDMEPNSTTSKRQGTQKKKKFQSITKTNQTKKNPFLNEKRCK